MQIQANASFPLKKIGLTTDTTKETELQKACKNFEAIILQQMLTAMRKSVPKDGLMDNDFSQDMYQSMYDEGLAKEIASGRGLGLADSLYKQLSGDQKTGDRRQETEVGSQESGDRRDRRQGAAGEGGAYFPAIAPRQE